MNNAGLNNPKEDPAVGSILNQDEKSFREKQQRLQDVDKILAELQSIWREQFDELIGLLGIRVKVDSSIETGNRHSSMLVQSQVAQIDLRFAVFADEDVRNITFQNNLQVIPPSLEHDSHDELTFAVTDIDKDALSNWIFHRILVFKKTYIDIHKGSVN